MKRSIWCVAALLLGAGACSDPTDNDPGKGSETHWLESCDEDAQCGSEFACVCGICTIECVDSEGCTTGGVCRSAAGVGIDGECQSAPTAGLCVSECSEDTDCEQAGTRCAEGHCLPTEITPMIAPSPECARDQTGSIEGIVRDFEGNPVADARVHWTLVTGGLWGPENVVLSADDGGYLLEGVPAQRDVAVTATSTESFGTSPPVATQICERSTGVDIALVDTRRGDIRGRVLFEDQMPAPGFPVSVVNPESMLPLSTTRSGDDGEYLFERVPIGMRTVTVYAEAARQRATTRVEVLADMEVIADDLVISAGSATVSGCIESSDGDQVLGAEVSFMQADGDNLYRMFSDADGCFAERFLVSGTYDVEVRHHQHCDLQLSGIELPASDLMFTMHEGSRIAGTVVDDDGNPEAAFRVVMHATTGPGGSPVQGTTAYRVLEHSDGLFRVELRAGTWDLLALTPDGRSAAQKNLQADCGEELLGVTLQLVDGIAMDGVVLDATEDTPVPNARLTPTFGSAGTGPFSDGDYGGARSDESGSFRISRVPDEPFRLVVSAPRYKTRVITEHPQGGEPWVIHLCHTAQSGCVP